MLIKDFITSGSVIILESNFWDINIADLVNMFSSVLSGIFIFLYISVVFNKKQKRTDIIFAKLTHINEELLRKIMNVIFRNIGKSLSPDDKHRLNTLFRLVSNEITAISTITKLDKKPIFTKDQCTELQDLRLDLKSIITDRPYSAGYILTSADETDADEKYQKLKSKISEYCYTLYK